MLQILERCAYIDSHFKRTSPFQGSKSSRFHSPFLSIAVIRMTTSQTSVIFPMDLILSDTSQAAFSTTDTELQDLSLLLPNAVANDGSGVRYPKMLTQLPSPFRSETLRLSAESLHSSVSKVQSYATSLGCREHHQSLGTTPGLLELHVDLR